MREYLTVDVLVCGGGPAGIGAALGATRAGVAAAMAVAEQSQPRELDVRAIQDALRANGVDLDYSGKANAGESI